MRKFECNRCGTCYSHLQSFQDGLHYGMYLSPKEAELLPEATAMYLVDKCKWVENK